jgi:hypothetical protein
VLSEKKPGLKMDADTRELIVFAALACFGLVLAWTHDDYLFTAVFKRRLPLLSSQLVASE